MSARTITDGARQAMAIFELAYMYRVLQQHFMVMKRNL
jgi:hypothetical protein